MLGMTYQRIKNGYESQAALARKFGVPRQVIQGLESGGIHHSVKWQVRLAELFNVPVSEITKEVS
jgi:DNA-binding XRE family transcriptional regulator